MKEALFSRHQAKINGIVSAAAAYVINAETRRQ
jgi:hypothetical protein